MTDKRLDAFLNLLDIMDSLRSKCPWDKQQTFESLIHLSIEETYELSEAIIENDKNSIKEELGDLVFHIVFYSKIAQEKGLFGIADVLDTVCEKLKRRHPHVFGDVNVNGANEVLSNWEAIKLKEGRKSILGGVPKSLPAMVKSYRIQDKVGSAGFNWAENIDAWHKVKEEIEELENELLAQNKDKAEAEFGDVLFSLINMARLYNIDPEAALERTNKKFMTRFNEMEAEACLLGKTLQSMSLEEMSVLWEKAKQKLVGE